MSAAELPFNTLLGVGGFDAVLGYAPDPDLATWMALAPVGELVTIAQHNTLVASLGWMQSVLSTTPDRVRRLPGGVPFPFGAPPSGGLALGAMEYVSGDITLPAMRPAGTAAVAPPPSHAGTYIVTNAERRRAFDAVTAHIANLDARRRNWRIQLDDSPESRDLEFAAGGNPFLIAGVAIVAVGILAYAGYSAYVAGKVAEANAQTAQVRIQEDARVAIVQAQTHARLQALAQRLAFAQATGSLPPPSPIEEQAIVIPDPVVPPASDSWGAAAKGAVVAILLGGASYGAYRLDQRTRA